MRLRLNSRFGLPETVALAAVALIGYLFGQRTRSTVNAQLDQRRQQELERAARIAWQLENVADALRRELVTHHSQLTAFKRRLRQAQASVSDSAWEQLCVEAEAMLGPTMQLAHQLSHAYDQIRQQSDALETFTHGRTDPLTGVGNSRALDQQLQVLLRRGRAWHHGVCDCSGEPGPRFDHAGRAFADCYAAALAEAGRRDSDAACATPISSPATAMRSLWSLMPQTSLAGASVFGDRLQKRVANDLQATVCCGMTEMHAGDDSRSLCAGRLGAV